MHLICLVICCDCPHLAFFYVYACRGYNWFLMHLLSSCCWKWAKWPAVQGFLFLGISDCTSVGTMCSDFLKLFSNVSRIQFFTLFQSHVIEKLPIIMPAILNQINSKLLSQSFPILFFNNISKYFTVASSKVCSSKKLKRECPKIILCQCPPLL